MDVRREDVTSAPAVAERGREPRHGHDTADLLIQPPVAAFGTLEFGNAT
jgi:hypothetical protein